MLFILLQINGFQVPSLTIWILAWIFLVIGLSALTILVVYTIYGREISIKLSIISISISAALLGFSFHFFLIIFGI
ncbi:MAG: hypothetical protein KGD68_07470 [Candidatus Lokiarchaeota archaeon]|nr:hypothetical protein [Candidatus Lokiarchaeota archaeon]